MIGQSNVVEFRCYFSCGGLPLVQYGSPVFVFSYDGEACKGLVLFLNPSNLIGKQNNVLLKK